MCVCQCVRVTGKVNEVWACACDTEGGVCVMRRRKESRGRGGLSDLLRAQVTVLLRRLQRAAPPPPLRLAVQLRPVARPPALPLGTFGTGDTVAGELAG